MYVYTFMGMQSLLLIQKNKKGCSCYSHLSLDCIENLQKLSQSVKDNILIDYNGNSEWSNLSNHIVQEFQGTYLLLKRHLHYLILNFIAILILLSVKIKFLSFSWNMPEQNSLFLARLLLGHYLIYLIRVTTLMASSLD